MPVSELDLKDENHVIKLLQESHSYPWLRKADGQYFASNMCGNCQKQPLWLRSWVSTTTRDDAEGDYRGRKSCFRSDLKVDCPSCVFWLHALVYSTWRTQRPFDVRLYPERRESVVGLYLPVLSRTGGKIVASITPPKDPNPGSIYGRRLHNTVDFPLLKSWMLRCCNNHNACSLTERPFLTARFRLIDCQTRNLAFCDSKEDIDFVTLSYLWGNQNSMNGRKTDSCRLLLVPGRRRAVCQRRCPESCRIL